MDHELEGERYTFIFRIPIALTPYDHRVTPCYRKCWGCGVKFLMLTREQKHCDKCEVKP